MNYTNRFPGSWWFFSIWLSTTDSESGSPQSCQSFPFMDYATRLLPYWPPPLGTLLLWPTVLDTHIPVWSWISNALQKNDQNASEALKYLLETPEVSLSVAKSVAKSEFDKLPENMKRPCNHCGYRVSSWSCWADLKWHTRMSGCGRPVFLLPYA